MSNLFHYGCRAYMYFTIPCVFCFCFFLFCLEFYELDLLLNIALQQKVTYAVIKHGRDDDLHLKLYIGL